MTEQTDLLAFLAETAHDLATAARTAPTATATLMTAEAEELMAIRANLLDRAWDREEEEEQQLSLPLEVKAAA